MAPWRGRLGTPASGRHSGPQGRGGEDPNRWDGSRLGTSPPTDEMAYSRRRNGRDGLEPPPGERGRPPGGTRGSAKPGRMTRRQASVSAARFLPGGVCGGPDHAGSCRWDSTQRPPGPRAVPCRSAGTCDKPCLPLPCTRRTLRFPPGRRHLVRQTVSATPMYRSRRTLRFPPGRRHLGTGSPSRRPPSAGCAGRRYEKSGLERRRRAPRGARPARTSDPEPRVRSGSA